MVPEAPIDGTMPSVFPEDRSGDFTFTRGSNLAATRVASNGLIEKGRENLLLQSNQFDTTWSAILGANLSGGQSGYDGSNDAWRFTKASGQSSRIYQNITLSPTVHTTSIYAKAGTLQYLAILEFSGPFVYFDLQNGTIGTISGSPIDVKIEEVGTTGWYRCSVTDKYDITQLRIYATDTDGSISGSGNIYIQDAQVEAGVVTTSYIESGATAGKAGLLENEPRIDFTGGGCGSLLLEPQRSNLVANSEYLNASSWSTGNLYGTLTDNVEASPEGKSNAASMVANATNNVHYFDEASFSGTAGVDYTFSFFAKSNGSDFVQIATSTGFLSKYQNYNITTGELAGGNAIAAGYVPTIEPIGSSGWYRVSLKATPTTNNARFLIIPIVTDTTRNPSFVGNGNGVYVWGIQKEAGSYPTSYIPTYGSSVTRSGDVCNGAGNASTFNSAEGVLYLEIAALADDLTNRGISITDGTSTDRITFLLSSQSNTLRVFGVRGSLQFNLQNSSFNTLNYNKIAVLYQLNNFKFFINGTQIGSSTSGAVPIGLNSIVFDNGSGGLNFYGKTKQVLYFPTALTDEECSALTQP
mgnify:CR=1 FL=1